MFGQPGGAREENADSLRYDYLAPVGTLTRSQTGYTSFEIHFIHGRVHDWRIFTGNPSYSPKQRMPSFARWELPIVGILFVLGIGTTFLVRRVPAAVMQYGDVLKAFAEREISTSELPPEFRFITHETTLQEVLDKAGPYTRSVRVPVNPNAGLGYGNQKSRVRKRASTGPN